MTDQGPGDKADPELHEAVTAARLQLGKRTTGAHSALYEWLWTRYSGMAPELNPPRTPNWTALAKTFGALGVFDGKGQAPKPVTVRQTWVKVNRAKELIALGGAPRRRRGKNLTAAAEPLAAQAQAIPSTPAAPLPAANLGMLPHGIEPAEEAPPRFTFKFASAKDWTKEPNKGDE